MRLLALFGLFAVCAVAAAHPLQTIAVVLASGAYIFTVNEFYKAGLL